MKRYRIRSDSISDPGGKEYGPDLRSRNNQFRCARSFLHAGFSRGCPDAVEDVPGDPKLPFRLHSGCFREVCDAAERFRVAAQRDVQSLELLPSAAISFPLPAIVPRAT